MSADIQQACLTALGEGPMTIADLTEATGYERTQVAMAMQALKVAGAVYTGRGGWRPVDESGERPSAAAAHVVIDQADRDAAPATAPAARPTKQTRAGKRQPRPAKLATVSQLGVPAATAPAVRAPRQDGACAFAIGEAGELLVTKEDATKFASFSPEETARLAAFLERYRAMLPVIQEAA